MPWKAHGVMGERLRFVQEWRSGDWNLAELCRFYGVSTATGYRWLGRFEGGGVEALRDRSRAPHRRPNAVSPEMEDLVIICGVGKNK
jgi:transposase